MRREGSMVRKFADKSYNVTFRDTLALMREKAWLDVGDATENGCSLSLDRAEGKVSVLDEALKAYDSMPEPTDWDLFVALVRGSTRDANGRPTGAARIRSLGNAVLWRLASFRWFDGYADENGDVKLFLVKREEP